jgi:hypothetical protein
MRLSFRDRFPILDGLVDEKDAEGLERRFNAACARADIDPESPEAEPIGIDVIAEFATGWSSMKRDCNPA